MTSPKIGAALLVLTLAFGLPGSVQAQNALTWFHTYTVPGNYAVGGVDLVPVSFRNGLRTRRVHITGVPANAEILAAFLYWETIWAGPESVLDGLRGQVKFRGETVSGVKSSSVPLSGNFAGCRGIGNGQTMTMMRADVLRLLPQQLDQNGDPTGRRVVNDGDLTASGLPLHTVTLPDSGIFNFVPQTAGASLLVVYQDPNPLTPLRTIVVYDGLSVQAPGAETKLTIRGMVDAANGSAARLSYIGGSGWANATDQVFFGGTNGSLARVDAGNPFPNGGLLTDRAWSNPTFNIAPGTWTPFADPVYGDQVETKITHTRPLLLYDCLSTGAVVLSAAAQDGEAGGGDGLPDKLEDVSGLLDPTGKPYPDLHAMGASSTQRDLLVEVGAMKSAGWDAMSAQIPTPGPHNHMPTPAVLKKVGDALAHPPVGKLPIFAHFDVGDVGPLSSYRALGGEYLSHEADSYLIQVGARGGEQIEEEASGRFPGFRGVVSWPAGYQFLAAAPVGANGQELAGDACDTDDPGCRRRFDANRQGLFHYVLYAHARSAPKSEFPCLAPPDLMGFQEPVDFPVGLTHCGMLDENDLFYTPKSVSGIAELPGRYAMVSLGLWDHAVGSEDMQANTTLHELGHNLNLWHGGAPPVFTGVGSNLHVFLQPNCRPNYLSIMSYLFQATGVKDAAGHAQTRLSGEVNGPINEQFLTDGPLGLSPDAPYTSWYAPKEPGTFGAKYNLTTATKHCDGTPLESSDPAVGMVRLDAASPDASVDWAGNGGLPQYAGGQDVNFDGLKDGVAATLAGYNDWDGIALNRLGAGHDVAELSLGLGLDFSGLDFSGLDFSGLDFSGLGLSGLDFSGLDFSGLDFSGLDFSGLDFSGLDFSGLEAEVDAELTYENVVESIAPGGSSGPRELKAFVRGTDGSGGTYSTIPVPGVWPPPGEPTDCDTLDPDACHRVRLDWLAPSFGTPDSYSAARVWDPTGTAVAPSADSEVDRFTATPGTSLIDSEELPNAQRFIYFVQGSIAGELGSLSNFAVLQSRNDPPKAYADGAVTNEDTSVVIPLLDNDTDIDTASNGDLRVASITNVHGGIAELIDGGRNVRFTPGLNLNSGNTPGGFGFSYQADDGVWSRDPEIAMSLPSNAVAVSITVNPVNDQPTANAIAVGTLEDTAQVITLTGGDVETCDLTFSIVSGPSHGSLSGLADNACVPGTLGGPVFNADSKSVTYTPATNYNGTDSFTYKVVDTGDGASAALYSTVVTVSITIAPVNDVPTVDAKTVSTTVNTAKAITLSATDVETCNLTFSTVSGPSHGTLSVITNNACVPGTLAGPFNTDSAVVTYTPTAGYVGPDSFTYKVYDTGDGSSPALYSTPATVSITVVGATTSLTSVGAADLWLGLKNSADVGTKFDVKAEVFKGTVKVATGQLNAITLGNYSSTFLNFKAVLQFVFMSPVALPATLVTGDTVNLVVSVRVASTSSHSTAKATLWFNLPDATADNSSHQHLTIGGVNSKYFLVSGFALKKNIAGSGPIQSADVAADKLSFKTFGTWTYVVP